MTATASYLKNAPCKQKKRHKEAAFAPKIGSFEPPDS